jgi:hypothetical protein
MHLLNRKKLTALTAVVVLALFSIWAKAFWESMNNFRIGERHLQAGNNMRAITFYDRSLRWYSPLNPYVDQSARRLWQIALRAEQHADIRLALIAVRTIRGGAYASRSFHTQGEELIRKCDAKIISLLDNQPKGQGDHSQTSLPGHRRYPAPDVFWSCILEVGLMGWIASVLGFLLFGLTRGPDTGLVSRSAIGCGALFIIFYTLWILGMMKA